MNKRCGASLSRQAGGVNCNLAPQKAQGNPVKAKAGLKNLSPSNTLKKAQGNQAKAKENTQKSPNKEWISMLLNIILSLINPSQKVQGASTAKANPLPADDISSLLVSN